MRDLSPEAREKISSALRSRWQDPEYRATHLPLPVCKNGGRKRGSPQSPEAKEKIRQVMLERWKDPAYRARHLKLLKVARIKGQPAAAAARRCRPTEGTPEYRQYEKIAAILGVAVAREQFKSAETEGAGRP